MTSELDPALHAQIVALSEQGDAHFEDDAFDQALALYHEALALVPAPATDWEAATWLYAAIGDAYFQQNYYGKSLEAFQLAVHCPEGVTNPYVWLMIGKSAFEMGDQTQAKDALLRAYMLEGDEIFDDEDEQYFALIADSI